MIELIGAALGGLFRIVPELLKHRNEQLERIHELARLDKQLEFQELTGRQKIDEVRIEADSAYDVAAIDALRDALTTQMQVTGNSIIDFITMTVRPFVTYLFVALYLLAKFGMFALMLQADVGTWEAIVNLYDESDRAILSSILAFWFLGRVFDKFRR